MPDIIVGERAWYDVRYYGAVADDGTDDVSAIQTAIDSASSHGGGTVFVPPDTFDIADTLFMKKKVNFVGVSKAESVLKLAAGAIIAFGDGTAANYARDITFSNLYIHCNNAATHGVVFEGTSNGNSKYNNIEHVNIGGSPDSAGVYFKNWCFSNKLYDVRVNGGKFGILLDNRCNDITIEDCDFNDASVWGIWARGTIEGSTLRILNCDLEGDGGTGTPAGSRGAIKIAGQSDDVSIFSNHIENFKGTAIRHEGGSCTIIGNHIVANDSDTLSKYGIDVSSNARIIGNSVQTGAVGIDSIAIRIRSGADYVFAMANKCAGTSFLGTDYDFVNSGNMRKSLLWDATDDTTFLPGVLYADGNIRINGNSTANKQLMIANDGTLRWIIRTTTESNDANLEIISRNDDGSIRTKFMDFHRTGDSLFVNNIGELEFSDNTTQTTAYAGDSYKDSKSWGLIDSVAISGEELPGWKVDNNITILEVAAYVDADSAVFNLEERAEGTPNTTGTDILNSDMTADTDQEEENTSFNNATININNWLVPVIKSAGANVADFSITVRYQFQ